MINIKNIFPSISKKRKYALSCLVLAGTLLLSGCSKSIFPFRNTNQSREAREETTSYSSNSSSNYDTSVTETPIISDLTAEDNGLLEETFNITDNLELVSLINDLPVEYIHSEFFQIAENLAAYNNISPTNVTSNTIIKNNQVDITAFTNAVIRNNKDYLQTNTSSPYEEISASTLNDIINIITNEINLELSNNSEIDSNIIDNTLKKLKILNIKNGFGNACVVYDEELLWISLANIENQQKDNPNILESVVTHESRHLIQIDYTNNPTYENNLGLCYSFDNITVDSLFWDWFIEGSAEKLRLAEDESAHNYYNNVKDIEAMTLALLVNPSVSATTIEELMLTRDLNKFFTIFNATTENQKKEIIEMMFALEIIHTRDQDFISYYEEKTGQKLDYTASDEMSLYLKASVATSLTKVFYSNLSNVLVTNTVSLKDIYSLIATFETEMNRLTKYGDSRFIEHNQEFIVNYKTIRDLFFSLLENSTEYSKEQLTEIYLKFADTYFSKYNQVPVIMELDFLDNQENSFLLVLNNSRLDNRTSPII